MAQDITPQAEKAAQDAELAKLEAEANAVAAAEESGESEEAEQAPEAAEGEDETPSSESPTDESEPSTDESTEQPEGEEADEQPQPEGQAEEEGAQEDQLPDEELLKQLKPKAQKRFQQLVKGAANAKTLEEENRKLREANEFLSQQLGKPQTQQQQPTRQQPAQGIDPLPWETGGQQPGQQPSTQGLTPQQVQQITQEQIANQRRIDNYNADAMAIAKAYPELDDDSDQYDESLALELARDWLARFKSGEKDLRLKDYVDAKMKRIRSAQDKAVATTNAKTAAQAATQAIKPTGTRAPKKDVTQKLGEVETIEDLEKLESEINKQALPTR